jgi:hypothetical protein
MKDKVLFKSREYGYNGHNYCELRMMDTGELRLWVHDGGTNCLICLDRAELLTLGKMLKKHGGTSPETHESTDIFKRNLKSTPIKRKRKPRSDKGKTRTKKPLTTSMNMDSLKAEKIAQAMEG